MKSSPTELKPHIHLSERQITDAKITSVVTCGDPKRAAKIASLLENSEPLAQNREYHSYKGTRNGKNILVLSHGVGSAGAAICFQEVLSLGIKNIIRVGTAGGLQKDSKVAGLVVATAAARKDGVSSLMVPEGFPAVGDLEMTQALYERAKKEAPANVPSVERGIILTSDLFYPGLLDDQLKLYSQAGVKAVEMEVSTLYTIAELKGARASAIVVLDGNPLFWDQGVYAPGSEPVKRSIEIAIQCALDVLAFNTH